MADCATTLPHLEPCAPGVWVAPDARIIDRAGLRTLPIGDDSFATAAQRSVLVDKTMLIADVLNSGYKVVLFCRPRRFGKTLNMTMLRAFFELPSESDPNARNLAPLFAGTEIWEAHDGGYRGHQGTYPVVYINLNTVKKSSWQASYGEIRRLVVAEYERHAYLAQSPALGVSEHSLLNRILTGSADDADIAGSLASLCHMLHAHHRKQVVLLVDEYDAPVMAAASAPDGGYCHEAVDFLKGWLTGALKGGDDFLAFSCLTGVQRISKESIFSDLNNLSVSTPLSTSFDERFGFSDSEVAALAAYLGQNDGCMDEARAWYDGYRFGNASVYNPWSVLNYFDQGCKARDYWGNTSGNAVLGTVVQHADDETLECLYRLCEPGGVVWAPLDLGTVFPDDSSIVPGTMWSMLYLAGYLTTNEAEHYGDALLDPYPLRVPNREISLLYQREIVARFAETVGGSNRYYRLHHALVTGDEATLEQLLRAVVRSSASYHDIVSENSAHMLLLGLLYGVAGYETPVSNREHGAGRFDIRLTPSGRSEEMPRTNANLPSMRPLITVEVKYLPRRSGEPQDSEDTESALRKLARKALAQIAESGYDEGDLPPSATGRLRWGIAFGRKDIAAVCERLA